MVTTAEALVLANKKIDELERESARSKQAPWVSSGLSPDSRPFSVVKAMGVCHGAINPESAKLEVDFSNRLRNLYIRHGFVPHYGEKSMIVPASSKHLYLGKDDSKDDEAMKLRQELIQMEKSWGPVDQDEVRYYRDRFYKSHDKALGTISDIAGGSLVAGPVLGEIIDIQRNLEVFTRAGAQEITMPPNGRISLPKLTGGATAYWVGEGTQIPQSQQVTGSLLLEAKKLGVLTPLNNELLRFSTPATESLVRNDIARVSALKADLGMLEGTGGTQIKGIINYATTGNDPLLTLDATTVAANGNTFEAQDAGRIEGKFPDEVQEGISIVMRRDLYAAIANRRADAVAAGDKAGLFMFLLSRGEVERGVSRTLYGMNVVRSSQVSNTRVKGAGTNLTYVLAGYFPDWVIARMGVMEFMMNPYSDTAMQYDQTFLRGIQHIDAGARHPRSFVLMDSLLVA